MPGQQRPDGLCLRPCIAELLRTCHYPTALILRIEKIIKETNTVQDHQTLIDHSRVPTATGHTYRLLLSDGELAIQAVVNRQLHRLIVAQELAAGNIIELQRFFVNRAPRTNGQGKVVYLGIEKYIDHGNHIQPSLRNIGVSSPTRAGKRPHEASDDTGSESPYNAKLRRIQHRRTQPTHEDSDSDSDDFETSTVVRHPISARREDLRDVTDNNRLQWTREGKVTLVLGNTDSSKSDEPATIESIDETKAPLERESFQPVPKPMRLHTLASLLDPAEEIPRRNYRCKVFAVISWVSPSIVKRAGLPEKRHIKIHDPTIAHRYSGVSISVFVNARSFRPVVGTIALFTGMTAQKWDGEVILNAYEKDCLGKEWFLDSESVLESHGLAVQELKEFWNARVSRRK